MSNHPAPAPATSSASPAPGGYRLAVNNWLQHRGFRGRFAWDKPRSEGPHNDLTWHAVCRFDDKEYGRGAAKKLAAAKEEAARMALRRLEENFE